MAKLNTPFSGHKPLEDSRMKEIRKFINDWLMNPLVYCNYCGNAYFPKEKPCCERPEIGRNIDFCQVIIQQNKDTLLKNLNQYGATENLGMRMGLSMPIDLLKKLEYWHLKRFGHKLFDSKKNFRKFIKYFPMFAVCEKI